MSKRTKRISKLNKKPEESRIELAKAAKKLSNKTLKDYFKIALPIFSIELALLLSMLAISKSAGSLTGIILICGDGLVTLTYFVIFDAVPARKMKKGGEDVKGKLSPNQIKVFYAALKTRAIFRTLGNVIMTLVILIITLVVFVV